jgi:hypothetical protein
VVLGSHWEGGRRRGVVSSDRAETEFVGEGARTEETSDRRRFRRGEKGSKDHYLASRGMLMVLVSVMVMVRQVVDKMKIVLKQTERVWL